MRSRSTLLRAGAVGAVGAALAVALAGASARADQTVRFTGPDGAAEISLIGDSTLTGVRWYDDYGALERFSFVFSAESCRRTAVQSCISREGYRSANVLSAMRQLGGELGEVLVVMSGYNDPAWSIDDAIDGVLAEAREQGVPRVIWLTLRTNDVDYSDPQEQTSTETFADYNEHLIDAAGASGGYLQIADWATHSVGASGWFEYDGVHLTAAGVDALTGFIAEQVDAVLAGAQISPAAPPWTVLVPGAEGDVVSAVQSALLTAGVDVPGGADGVFGGDTMAAVAEFQRRDGDLQVTGAVDEATARALGVYGAPEAAAPTTGPAASAAASMAAPMAALGATTTAPLHAAALAEPGPLAGEQPGTARGPLLVAAAAIAALGAGAAVVFARRRQVAAGRAERRWARVHPATSPLRSVADMRRAGQLPGRAGGSDGQGPLYDHELEDVASRP